RWRPGPAEFPCQGDRRTPRPSTPQRRRQTAADGARTSVKYTLGCSTMRDLSPADRPREKLWQHGVSALGDNELVALVVGHGGRRGSALDVANAVLANCDGLHGLMRCSSDDLARVDGIGRVRAAQILAAVELGRRTLVHAPAERIRLTNPNAAALYLL